MKRPADVARHLVTASRSAGGTSYEIFGNPQHPVIVLIHGLGLRKSMWDDYVSALADNNRVIAYDLFGHGASSAPPAPASLKLFSKQLTELLDELNIQRATLIGFSLGGMINRRFTMDYPERVESLIILNSPHERRPHEQRQVEERAMQSAEGGPATTLDATLERWFTADFLSNNTNAVKSVRDWVLDNDPTVYAQCRFVLAAGVRELIRPDPPIRKPTLIVTSANDRGNTPEMAHRIATEISGAETVIVPRLRHLGLLETPDTFIRLIKDFLERFRDESDR